MQDKAVEPGRRADPDDSGFGDEAGHRNWPEWLAAARTSADLTADPVAPTTTAQLEQMLDGRDLDSPTLGTRDRAGYGGGVNFSDADGPRTPKPRRGGGHGAVDWPRSPGLQATPSHLDAHSGGGGGGQGGCSGGLFETSGGGACLLRSRSAAAVDAGDMGSRDMPGGDLAGLPRDAEAQSGRAAASRDPNDLHWLAEGPLPPSPRRQPTYQQFGWL